jgi:hypothetical protein
MKTNKIPLKIFQEISNNEESIVKEIFGIKPPPEKIEDRLYEICDNTHASCNDDCPVYRLNGSKVLDTVHDFEKNRGCDCFKNGEAMREYIENVYLHPEKLKKDEPPKIRDLAYIQQKFERKNAKARANILWEALEIMQSQNSQSLWDCTAKAMGYKPLPDGKSYSKEAI